MSSIRSQHSRWWLPLLLTLAGLARVVAAEADPAAPETPATTLGAPGVEATPVEAAAPLPLPPPAPRVPRRWRDREQVVGIFQNAHLRANEIAEQVVTVFGHALIDGEVSDNAVSVFGGATANGEIEGNFVCVFGDGTVNRNVGGNVVCVFGKLTVGPGVVVEGNLVSIGSVDVDESAHVEGQDVTIPLPGVSFLGRWVRESLLYGRLYPLHRTSTWVFLGVALVFSLLLSALFRGPIEANVDVLERRPAGAFVNGLLGMLLVPPVILLLTITGVGVLVVPFVGAGILFATAIGVVAVHRFCGARLGLGANPVLALGVGHGLFGVLYALPVIGLLTWMGVMMLGFGTALTAWGEARRRDKRRNGTPPAPAAAPLAPAPTTSSPSMATTPSPAPAPIVARMQDFSSAPADDGGIFGSPPISPPATPLPPPAADAPVMTAPSLPVAPLERAEFSVRLAATFLDLIFVGVLSAFPFSPLSVMPFPLLWVAYHLAFWSWRATTFGGIVIGLRIDRLDGRKVDLSVATARVLGAIMSFFAACLGFLWVIWDPERQAWHDKIAGTVIVRVPKGHSLI